MFAETTIKKNPLDNQFQQLKELLKKNDLECSRPPKFKYDDSLPEIYMKLSLINVRIQPGYVCDETTIYMKCIMDRPLKFKIRVIKEAIEQSKKDKTLHPASKEVIPLIEFLSEEETYKIDS